MTRSTRGTRCFFAYVISNCERSMISPPNACAPGRPLLFSGDGGGGGGDGAQW
jgi:hypothetical protein